MKTRLRRGLYAPELLEARIAPATFMVTNTFDSGDGSLRKAIDDANNSPGLDTVAFDKGLTGTIGVNTVEIGITDAVTIKGPGIDLITVTGNDARRIFNIAYTDPALLKPTTISGLTLIDGMAVGDGGAIKSTEALTLKNVVVSSSFASIKGGGVAVDTDGKISIDSSRISDNEAGATAGGLYLASLAGVSIVKSTIAGNTADANGGLYARIKPGAPASATFVLDKVSVIGNSATAGLGGGMTLERPGDGKIVVKNSLISGNSSTDRGGGLYLDEGALVVMKTTFSGNTAATGGAVSGQSAAAIDISGSRFLANTATAGAGRGGGALDLQGITMVKIAGTIFAGNSAASDGGAISAEMAGSPVALDIKASSFLGNTAADDGGAIALHNKAVLTLKSSTLSGNVATNNGGGIYADGGSSLTATGNKFTENRTTTVGSGYGGAIGADGSGADAVAIVLTGNLFQANVSTGYGGAVSHIGGGTFSSKGDKVLGNVARDGDGGGFYLNLAGDTFITATLFQGNVASSDGGALRMSGKATLTGLKVLDNVASMEGGGIFCEVNGAEMIFIFKSTITGNVAATGGGISGVNANVTIDAATMKKIIGNSARTDPNIHVIP